MCVCVCVRACDVSFTLYEHDLDHNTYVKWFQFEWILTRTAMQDLFCSILLKSKN